MDIMKMSAQEICMISVFTDLAKEALEAEKLINTHFNNAFGIDNKKIKVYHTESCDEYYGDGYLTIDGVFEYNDNWWGGRKYSFECSADGIYHMLRSCYLRKHNLQDLDPDKFDCEIEYIDEYFRNFISRIESK